MQKQNPDEVLPKLGGGHLGTKAAMREQLHAGHVDVEEADETEERGHHRGARLASVHAVHDADVARALAQPQVHVLADREQRGERRRFARVEGTLGHAGVELHGAIFPRRQVVHGVLLRMVGFQEGADVVDVVSESGFQPFSWERHDWKEQGRLTRT